MTTYENNRDTVQAFAFADPDSCHRVSGRNRNNSLSFKDGVLYSYKMPIAWYNARGSLLVVSTGCSPSVTTSRHIQELFRYGTRQDAWASQCGVNLALLDKLGIDKREVLQGVRISDTALEQALVFERDGVTYTVFRASDNNAASLDEPIYTRYVTPSHWVAKGVPDVRTHRAINLVPDVYRDAALAGLVAFTGEWFFKAHPELRTQSIPGVIETNASLDAHHRVTEKRGEYVRGVVYNTTHDTETLTLISLAADGPYKMPGIWWKPFRPLVPATRFCNLSSDAFQGTDVDALSSLLSP